MSDLFEGTPHEDKRTAVQKEFDLLQQELAEFRRKNQFSIDGLPLFSINEREARITKQHSLFEGA